MIAKSVPIYVLATLWLAALTTVSAARKPNVIIFFTDDQGTLDANCYGSTDLHTPAMDELAATGVRFTQAYAHCVCTPTRVSRRWTSPRSRRSPPACL